MAVRPFVAYPDKRLKTAVPPVGAVTADVLAIWDDLADTMYALPTIVGLAAPQIGAMQRLAVVDCSPDRRAPVFLANPDIIAATDEMRSHEEASPNLPGISAIIERPGTVTVRFLNRDGVAEERSFTDLWAISVQHQIDHLNGRLYVDHLSPLRRRMLLRKAAKRRPV